MVSSQQPSQPATVGGCSCPGRFTGRHNLACEARLRAAGLMTADNLCPRKRHEMTPGNTYHPPGGGTHCAACRAEADEKRRRSNQLALYQQQAARARERGDWFGQLVALLRAELLRAGEQRHLYYQPGGPEPKAFEWRPWVRDRVPLERVAELTGFSAWTLKTYAARARRHAAAGTTKPQTMPLPVTGSGEPPLWEVGALALWRAAALTSTGQRPRPHTRWAARDQRLAEIRDLAAANDGYISARDVAARYGVHVDTAEQYLVDAGLPTHAPGDGHAVADETLLGLVDDYLDAAADRPSVAGFRVWLREQHGWRVSPTRAGRILRRV